MGKVPCHADCENEDPRIDKCDNCGRDNPETINVCPHCNPQATELRKLKTTLNDVEIIFRELYAAHLKAQEEITHKKIFEMKNRLGI